VVVKKIKEVAAEWMKHANLKFVYVEHIEISDVRVSFNKQDEDGTWSLIGTDVRGTSKSFATMNFSWLERNTLLEEYRRTVLHEFGHMLGLIHEHQHPDRAIQFNDERVREFYKKLRWSDEAINHNILHPPNPKDLQYNEYDPHSIMHYTFPHELRDDSAPNVTNPNTKLSKGDIDFISSWYPFPEQQTCKNWGAQKILVGCALLIGVYMFQRNHK